MVQHAVDSLRQYYDVVAVVDLDQWPDSYDRAQQWLKETLQGIHRHEYQSDQRIVFTMTGDQYVVDHPVGLVLRNLVTLVNEIDISAFFVIVVSTNPDLEQELAWVNQGSSDTVAIKGQRVDGPWQRQQLDRHPSSLKEKYQYGSLNPIKIQLQTLTARQQYLLTHSKTFCMYPWVHLHAFPTGDAHACCYSEMQHGIGNLKTQTIEQIWNDSPMRELRVRMLNDQPSGACKKCYEQEQAGFFSGRQSANKHHGHHIQWVDKTHSDGTLDHFQLTYWDIRFSNLCNLSCRSCGHIFSSAWYQDQAQIAGPQWSEHNRALVFAGRDSQDAFAQLIEHVDSVEQIYFAGGEPLMMEEHYLILEELERRKRFDVRLIYNTNFTHTKLRDRYVFDYWKRFDSVSVGASIDASGTRAEYIRKGTKWDQVERNRRLMMTMCPDVDFYISPTLSIMNLQHLPDFHRRWTEAGLIKAQDLNVNILQDPAHYRIDIAPSRLKQQMQQHYQAHIDWLRPQDPLNRATVGFESAIKFMTATDNSHLIAKFWQSTMQLDHIRNESWRDHLPELDCLNDYTS